MAGAERKGGETGAEALGSPFQKDHACATAAASHSSRTRGPAHAHLSLGGSPPTATPPPSIPGIGGTRPHPPKCLLCSVNKAPALHPLPGWGGAGQGALGSWGRSHKGSKEHRTSLFFFNVYIQCYQSSCECY